MPPAATASRRRNERRSWVRLPADRLLDVRLCDLQLRLPGTVPGRRVQRLYRELASRGLRFRPHVWIGEEWFTPDGVPGFAVPFYLVHPRLVTLQREEMLEAPDAGGEWCMRILRHEAGHALEHAFRLGRRAGFRKHFGTSRPPYPESHRPMPFGRDHVLNLETGYAQSHACEDFAETFAVWLQRSPGSWRREYRDWGALEKLEWVDALMRELARRTPPVRSRRELEPVSEDRRTLREFYEGKRRQHQRRFPRFHDRDLRWLFCSGAAHAGCRRADSFVRSLRPQVRRSVAECTGQYHLTIDRTLEEITDRCRTLDLRVHAPGAARIELATLVAVQTMGFLLARRRPRR